MTTIRTIACLVLVGLLAACSRDAVPVRYGRDECAHCKMTIVDQRFGAELITSKGKVLVFDDLGCLFEYQQANASPGAQVYVIDYAQPATLLPAETASFLVGDEIRSPMASGIASFGAGPNSQQARQQFGHARLHAWRDLSKAP